MIARHNINHEDLEKGSQFDDMVFRGFAGHLKVEPMWELIHNYKYSFEVPYRQFLPENVEGLLAAGRACNLQSTKKNDPNAGAILRMRWQMFMAGQTVCTAAAMSVKDNVQPSKVDVQKLRRTLYEAGFYMGDSKERLGELGLG